VNSSKVAEVLIDTSAWVAFFRGHEPLASRVDAALADGSAAVCGMIELEVLQNVRPDEEDVRSLMRSTLRLKTDEGDYREAGERLAGLRRRGVTLPVTDGLIAQVALRYQVPLLEFDKHFDHIDGLELIAWRAS
jgi:predicted nucleic acid-binding protein